ncbi:patatin-like phospholipase family protein [Algoriphagus antarcticus]|uniref:Patatin-like phospholipase n=1 Tax=Algoriphagus antarcticus TaxID=238540 RepID=A0A3E0DVN3_9BACT|nr:patatin-like phospholipase family protein [Algoriphagus antarcticus]REG88694.1 patatin-like phospholipase [Algoriphagus antarcticus]
MPNFLSFNNRNVRIPRNPVLDRNPENLQIRPNPVDADVIFEGGATLGAAYVGSLTLLESAGVQFKRIAGNSAGAITAALVAADYKANEIEWIMSNFDNRRIPKPNGLKENREINALKPIDFMDFLDFPNADSISVNSKRKTMLWKFLKGEIIDNILSLPLPVPNLSDTVNSIIVSLKFNSITAPLFRTIPQLERVLRPILNSALFFLPTGSPTLNQFNPFDTQNLRIKFADEMWDNIAKINPLLLIMTQFTYEGSIFEGNEFLNTMNRLLSAKLAHDRTVLFSDLPIPLAVVSHDYAKGKVVVYSSRTHPGMSVAEAVRRSMSLPLIFQPRKAHPGNRGSNSTATMIDGGVGSNFPIWLFNSTGDTYWPQGSVSTSRIKIGLSLNEKDPAPNNWDVNPAKFRLNTNGQVDLMEVIKSMLISRFRDLNMFNPSPRTTNSLNAEMESWKFMEVLVGFLASDKEEAARKPLLTSIMNGKNYFDISIPLLGFHGFDFSVNSDRDDMDAIAERGYAAALDALQKAPMAGNVPPIIRNPALFRNPFH